MAKFPDLPPEIQLLVAQNFSDKELYRFRELNSSFFKHWIDINWRCVLVNMEYGSGTFVLKCLRRVVDPFVAGRLRHLSIRFPSSAERKSRLQKPIFDTIVSTFLDSLALLPSVTSLDIEIFEWSPAGDFFQTITSLPIAKRLKDLRLTGPLHDFAWLWEYSAHSAPFPNLTGLRLEVVHSSKSKSKSKSKKQPEPYLVLVDFFRSLIPTLQHLHIKTILDISGLFKVLFQPLSQSEPIFPELISLTFRIHSNTRIWTDPGDKEPLDAWLTELVNDDNYQLPYLQTLETNPSAETESGFSPILTLIKKTARTLTNVEVSGRDLTNKEALQVIDALTQGKTQVPGTTTIERKPRELKGLMLSLNNLSVPFIDLLATKFRQLEDLTLWASNIDDKDLFFSTLRPRRWHDFDCKVKESDTQDILHTWKLQELDIQCENSNSHLSTHLQAALAAAIPALVHKRYGQFYGNRIGTWIRIW